MQAHNNITEHMISQTRVQSPFTTDSLSSSTAMTLPPCIHMTYVLKCNQPQHVSPLYNKFSLNPKTPHENVVSLLRILHYQDIAGEKTPSLGQTNMSSASLVDPLPAKKKRNDKRGPLPGIWSAKDGPGPANWRRDHSKQFSHPLSLKRVVGFAYIL
jgi:hypothetical protein